MQYEITKAGFGYSDILDLPIDVSGAGEVNIMDIATGTGAWILDVARIPEISGRLAPNSINRVKLFACDISNAKFPSKSLTDSVGIYFFEQDVIESFPEDMYGQFDLIHVSLLCFALTRQGWDLALANIDKLLSE
jgi:SAM-dependent methyltransferase